MGDILADPHNILNRWKNYFYHLLNVQWVGVLGRQKYRQQSHLCHSLAPQLEVAIGKLRRYKSPGADQIPAELIQAEGEHCILRYISLLSRCGTKKNCLTSGKSQLSYLFTIFFKRKIALDKTGCSNYQGISLLSASYKIISNILISGLIPYADEIVGIHQC
jgi:hypothetical protein